MTIEFEVEIREVKCKKLISLDKEITIVLNTNDINVLDLGKIESEKTVKVVIEEILTGDRQNAGQGTRKETVR